MIYIGNIRVTDNNSLIEGRKKVRMFLLALFYSDLIAISIETIFSDIARTLTEGNKTTHICAYVQEDVGAVFEFNDIPDDIQFSKLDSFFSETMITHNAHGTYKMHATVPFMRPFVLTDRLIGRVKNSIVFQTREELLSKLSFDTLTGIYSRQYMEEHLKHIMQSHGTKLSLFMIDIDNFKKYNDTYGHSKGDKCLKAVAEALHKCVTRSGDFVARYGGEEFIVILPNTNKEEALRLGETMLRGVEACKLPHEKNTASKYTTVSIGITTGMISPSDDTETFIKRADKALYMSKEGGRNRCTFLE